MSLTFEAYGKKISALSKMQRIMRENVKTTKDQTVIDILVSFQEQLENKMREIEKEMEKLS